MAQLLRRYETLIIFDPDLTVDNIDELTQKARESILSETGQIIKTERWGLRDLAFELKGRRKGYYLLLEFAAVPAAATELARRLNLSDSILKFQTVKLQDKVDPSTLPEEILTEAVQPVAVAKVLSVKEDDDDDDDEDDIDIDDDDE